MISLKKKLKKILSLASIGFLFTGIALGITTKESNRQDYRLEDRYDFNSSAESNSSAEIEQPKLVCKDLLEKDENSFVFEEYSKVAVVECVSVGCGGIF